MIVRYPPDFPSPGRAIRYFDDAPAKVRFNLTILGTRYGIQQIESFLW